MKPKLSQYKPESENDTIIKLQSFEPGWNNEFVFWSSRETGFASYVLVQAHVKPTTFKQVWFTTEDGRQVQLISVNGWGQERWLVHNNDFIRGADLEAKQYFNLH